MFAVNLDSVFHLFQRDLTRRRNCSMPPARAKAPAAWRKWRRCVAPYRKQFATEPVMSPAGLCGDGVSTSRYSRQPASGRDRRERCLFHPRW
jgi:hypothetical protein